MLSSDFSEFVRSLNAREVRYLVVGGYAVAIHGYPRYTKDLDVWIQIHRDNAQRVVDALTEFGLGSLGLKPEDFLDSDRIIQLGYPPNRIDILTSLSGVEFESCFARRMVVSLDGVEVNFIDLADLRQNKRASGRLQDLADLEELPDSEDGAG